MIIKRQKGAPLSQAKSRILFSFGTMLSRITGMLSYSVKGAVFGASVYHDAFVLAYRIPNLLREMLAEGALGGSFTKVFTSVWEQDEARARRVLMDCLSLAFIALSLICLGGMIFSNQLVQMLTMGSESNSQGPVLIAQATGMTRVLFPFILFMSLGAIVSGVLHQRGRFFLSSVSSVALNVGFILGALVFSKALENFAPDWIDEVIASRGILGLAIGTLFGGFLQFAIQFSGIWREFFRGRRMVWSPFPLSSDVKQVLLLMAPMTIATSSGIINNLVNSNFATSLNAGAVTWIDYAFRVIHLPVGIFGAALGTVALPAMSRAIVKSGGKVDALVSRELQTNIELVLWLIVPCVAFIMLNSLEIVQVLYQYGRFNAADVEATSDTLLAYGFGILGMGLIKIMSPFYYAINRTSYAMKVSLASIGINFLLNLLFVGRFGHVGLAMTASAVVSLNATMLILGTIPERPIFQWASLFGTLGAVGLAAFCAWVFRMEVGPALVALLDGRLDLRWAAIVILVTNGVWLVACYGGAAMIRYRLSPSRLLAAVRARKLPS